MSYILQKINSQQVEPIITDNLKPEEIKGYEVIPMLYANILAAGYRGSGKTTTLFHIIKMCTDKNTMVIVFCSTHNNDGSYIEIKNFLEERGQPYVFYTDIIEDGVSVLDVILDNFQKEAAKEAAALKKLKEQKKKNRKLGGKRVTVTDDDVDEEEVEKKPKVKACKYLIVFDDISAQLRSGKSVERLLKAHRHYQAKVIISTQDIVDLKPSAKNQCNIFLVFKGFGEDRFEKYLYPYMCLRTPFDKFYDAYHDVTKEKGSFIFVDKETGELRRNFNQQIKIS